MYWTSCQFSLYYCRSKVIRLEDTLQDVMPNDLHRTLQYMKTNIKIFIRSSKYKFLLVTSQSSKIHNGVKQVRKPSHVAIAWSRAIQFCSDEQAKNKQINELLFFHWRVIIKYSPFHFNVYCSGNRNEAQGSKLVMLQKQSPHNGKQNRIKCWTISTLAGHQVVWHR